MTVSPHILMVCLGNICRSPTAEIALKDAAARRNIDIVVSSAGTGDWHHGKPADSRMTAAAHTFDLDLTSHVARQVNVTMMRDADLILAMDRTNFIELERLAAERHITTPIQMFRAFDPEVTDSVDVPDPYYGNGEGFTNVVSMCVRTAEHLLDTLTDQNGRWRAPLEEPS